MQCITMLICFSILIYFGFCCYTVARPNEYSPSFFKHAELGEKWLIQLQILSLLSLRKQLLFSLGIYSSFFDVLLHHWAEQEKRQSKPYIPRSGKFCNPFLNRLDKKYFASFHRALDVKEFDRIFRMKNHFL